MGYDRPTGRGRLAAEAMLRLWGPGLPPGAIPWRTLADDLTFLDDDEAGRERDLVVQGDSLSLEALAELVSYVPDRASLRGVLPADLRQLVEIVDERQGSQGRWQVVTRRVLEVAHGALGAAGAGVYVRVGDDCILDVSSGVPTRRVVAMRRVSLLEVSPLSRAVNGDRPVWDCFERDDPGGPTLHDLVCVPINVADTGAGPAGGALALAWPHVVGLPGRPGGQSALEADVAALADELSRALPTWTGQD